MKPSIYLLVIGLLVHLSLWSQSSATTVIYSGHLSDTTGKSIGYATLLLCSPDNKQTGTVTDSSGHFQLQISPGIYQITIQCLGYDLISKNISITTSLYDSIQMKPMTHLLKEIAVHAHPVERKADRYIVRISPTADKDGVELLQSAPGVWLAGDRLSINGASGTKVFVDNREIKLSGELLMTYLRSLKSENILRIEVLPMAGADRDANAQGGIIHIVLRRPTDNGLLGSLSATTAFAPSLRYYQPEGNLNIHSGKWDGYVSASGIFIPQNRARLNSMRYYPEPEKHFSGLTAMQQNIRYHTVRTGVVFTADTLNNIGAEFEYIRRSYTWNTSSHADFSTPCYSSESTGKYRQRETYDMYSGTVNYLRKLDSRGSVLKFITDFTSKNSQGNNDYKVIQQIKKQINDTIYRSRSSIDYRIATADFFWKQQIRKKSYIQAGVKYTYTDMKDNAHYEGLTPAKEWTSIPVYDYSLDYQEDIGALYTTYASDRKQWSFHIGLRGEYTRTTDRSNHLKRRYWDWFPHIDLSYAFDPVRQWLLIGQYARNIERPAFSTLNPNRIQTSEYTYQIGNPALHPTYIHRFSATLVYNYHYTLTVGGNLHRDLIREFGKQDAENSDISYITYENHYRENHWFAVLSIPWQPLSWFHLTGNIIGVRQCIKMYKKSPYNNHYLYFGNVMTSFYIPRNYTLELRYNGNSRLYSGNSEVAPYHTLHARISKKWKEGTWIFTLKADNLLNRKNSYVSHIEEYTTESTYDSAINGRSLKLSLTWNFNQGQKIKKITVEKNSAEERNRLNEKTDKNR